MSILTYDKRIAALIVIDPYNDFISEGGMVWDRLKAVAESNGCIPHMMEVLTAARKAGIRIFYAMHHRYRPGDTRHGNTSHRSRKPLGRTKRLRQVPGEARSAQNSCLNPATWWRRSIGAPAVLQIRTWICYSRNTGFISSSSLG